MAQPLYDPKLDLKYCAQQHVDCETPTECNSDPDIECADCGQTRQSHSTEECGEFVLNATLR